MESSLGYCATTGTGERTEEGWSPRGVWFVAAVAEKAFSPKFFLYIIFQIAAFSWSIKSLIASVISLLALI